MRFPLGKPLLVMLLVGLATGVGVALRSPAERKDLVLWVFSDSHREEFTPLLPAFEQANGRSVGIDLIVYRALYVRLLSLFMTGVSGPDMPDCVHVEINQVGKVFRPPLEAVGLRPLNAYLENHGAREIPDPSAPGRAGWHARLAGTARIFSHDGSAWVEDPARARPDMWIDRVIPGRLAPWTKQGVIFGVPQDVHPVTFTYREDLFRQAGVDLASARTWPEFHELCLRFKRYWAAQGVVTRHAMELAEADPARLAIFLLQRGINVVDDQDRIHLTDPRVAHTIAFYAGLVAGERRVAGQATGSLAVLARELASGDICGAFTADWAVHNLRKHATPGLVGRLRMIPLPVFDPGDRRTSTWGGTMIGIPKGCQQPDEAWKLIEHLYFSEAALERRLTSGAVLPALEEHWHHPLYHVGDPLFGGQRIGELYVELAAEIPIRHVTPSTSLAQAQLTEVLTRAIAWQRRRGAAGLEQQCQRWLEEAAGDLAKRMAHGRFER